MHITVCGNAKRLRRVTVHRSRTLIDADVERLDGLPLTALPRTLLDVAATETPDSVRAILEGIDRRELLDPAAIQECMARNPGHHGTVTLRSLIADHVPVGAANEGLERNFQLFLDAEGFPPPLWNALVCGLLVDCWWPEHDLVVELDSRDFHSHWEAAEGDRARDATLFRAGIASLRVTHRRLTRKRSELATDLKARLPVR